MEPLISVVVPVYNVERYLDDCIESIRNQSYTNLEILLVDDGSTDSCSQMCDAWAEKDGRIRVIHKENAGLGMARNTGIQQAAGKYICFFDSDDYVAPDILSHACAAAEEHSSDVVLFGMTQVDDRGNVRRAGNIEAKQTVFRGNDVQTKLLPDVINSSEKDVWVRNLPLSVCACLFSMELLRRTGWKLVSEREIISEDSYSLLQLYKDIRCAVVLPENGYFYRYNSTSLTQTYRQDRFEKTKGFYRKAKELCCRLDYSENVIRRVQKLFFAFLLGILKQIAAAPLSVADRFRILDQIVRDDCVQEVLREVSPGSWNRKVRIMALLLRHRLTAGVFAAAYLQAVIGK